MDDRLVVVDEGEGAVVLVVVVARMLDELISNKLAEFNVVVAMNVVHAHVPLKLRLLRVELHSKERVVLGLDARDDSVVHYVLGFTGNKKVVPQLLALLKVGHLNSLEVIELNRVVLLELSFEPPGESLVHARFTSEPNLGRSVYVLDRREYFALLVVVASVLSEQQEEALADSHDGELVPLVVGLLRQFNEVSRGADQFSAIFGELVLVSIYHAPRVASWQKNSVYIRELVLQDRPVAVLGNRHHSGTLLFNPLYEAGSEPWVLRRGVGFLVAGGLGEDSDYGPVVEYGVRAGEDRQ